MIQTMSQTNSLIEEFAQEVSRGVLTIRERAVEARLLAGREQMLLRSAFPHPVPPLRQVAGKGSLAKEPNYDDPAYLAAKEKRDYELMAAELAVAAGLVDGWDQAWSSGQDEDKARAWLVAASGRVLGALSLWEVREAYEAMGTMTEGLVVRAYARLVGTRPDKLPADQVQVLKVDLDAPPSELAIALRVHSRFGRDPASDWWASLDPAQKAVLVAFEHAEGVREDARKG